MTTVSTTIDGNGLSEPLIDPEVKIDVPVAQNVFLDADGNQALQQGGVDVAPVAVAPAAVPPPAATGGDEETGDITAEPVGAVGGEVQQPAFRDVWAALLFVGHQVAIFYLAFAWGVPSLRLAAADANDDVAAVRADGGDDDATSFYGFFYLCLVASVIAMVLSALSLSVLMRFAETMVQISLLISLVLNVLSLIYFVLLQYYAMIPVCAVFMLISVWYACSVWRRIPFAAANLKTALAAVRTNSGLVLVAYLVTIAVNLWSLVWLLAVVGVYVKKTLHCSLDGDGAGCPHDETGTDEDGATTHVQGFVGFLLSFYWTTQVGKNVLQVIVSGVVGTWWFAPTDANRCCSPAITDSSMRATTYSFGSVCLGSLVTAVLEVVHHMCRQARYQMRDNGNLTGALILCIIECLAEFLERIVAYFNKWAYTYVGLYGYDYLTAGKKVVTLFMYRGWTTIINDSLVLRTLSLVSFMIGILTGCSGIVLAQLNPHWMGEFSGTGGGEGDDEGSAVVTVVAFFIPFIIGTSISYVLMSVVASAVDTVIVCLAEAPLDLERNHPGLYVQMIEAWSLVYPDEFTMQQ